MPRRKPYTALGIRRVPCSRCGEPGVHQWQVCADGNAYRVACLPCDIELNRFAVAFMRLPDPEALLAAYEQQAWADAPDYAWDHPLAPSRPTDAS